MTQPLATDFPIDPTVTSGTALAAILNRFSDAWNTNNSGPTPPPDTFAGQWWLDTSAANPVMRIRNAANTAWLLAFNTVFDPKTSLAQLGIPNHDMMGVDASGSVYIQGANTGQNTILNLTKKDPSKAAYIQVLSPTSKLVWQLILADGTAASDLTFSAFDDAGNYLGSPLSITRATRVVSVATPAAGDRTNRVANTAFFGTEMPGAAALPGWQRMPNGTILQWGDQVVTTDAGGNAVLTFPLAFTASVSSVLMTNGNAGVGLIDVSALRSGWPTLTGAAVHVQNSNTGAAYVGNAQIAWLAIGR